MPLHKGSSWRGKTTCKMKYLWSLHRPHFRTSDSRSLGIWPKLVLRVHSPHLASNDNSAEIIRLASGVLISPMEHSAVSYPQRPNKNIRLHSGPLYHDQRISPTLGQPEIYIKATLHPSAHHHYHHNHNRIQSPRSFTTITVNCDFHTSHSTSTTASS